MKNHALRWGLVLSLLLTLVTVSAGAAGEIPNAPTRPDHTSHEGWTAWDGKTALTEAGNYYLADDADFTNMSDALSVGKGGTTINLCLNGKTISRALEESSSSAYCIKVTSGTVNICDCCATPGNVMSGEPTNNYNAYGLSVGATSTLNIFDISISNGVGRYGVFYMGSPNATGAPNGTLNLVSGSISGNVMHSGAPVYANPYAEVNMFDGFTISNNAANTAGGYSGGAIRLDKGSVFNMYGGTISGNTNVKAGGGVYVYGGTFNMYGGTITQNVPQTDANGIGGGVNVNSGTFNMYGGTISQNSGRHAGGVYVESGATMTMSGNAAVTGNTCTYYGGGVYTKGTLTMSGNATISSNINKTGISGAAGAGVFMTGTPTVTMNDSASITGNTSQTASGGGVYLGGGTLTMNGTSSISDNTASKSTGGGVFVNAGTFNMNGGTISGNTATTGGAVYAKKAFNMRNDAVITGNTATSGSHTGGVYVITGGTFHMYDGTISNNSGSYEAEAVYVKGGTFVMDNGTISGKTDATTDNKIDHNGVHITADGTNIPSFTMNGGTIKDFHVNGPTGGAVRVANGTFVMNGGVVENITKQGSGAAAVHLANDDSEFVMNAGAVIRNCTSSAQGAGVSALGGSSFTMNGGSLTGLNAQFGAVYAEGTSNVEINGGAITGNSRSGNGNMGEQITIMGNAVLEINGGTIGKGSAGNDVAVYSGSATATPKATINGGVIEGELYTWVTADAQNNGGTATFELNGGLYANKYTDTNTATKIITIGEGKEFKAYNNMYVLAAESVGTDMVLGQSLNVRFYIPVDGTDTTKTTAFATIEGHDEAQVEFDVVNDNYVVTVPNVAADEMTKTITIVLKDEDGNVLNADTDSIYEYGMRVLGDPEMSKAHAVVADMLRYGAAAQKYFAAPDTLLVENEMADYNVTFTGADGAALLATTKAQLSDITFAGNRAYSYANLTLDDMVDFNMYFWAGQIGEDKTYAYEINNGEKSGEGTFQEYLDTDSKLLYKVKIPNLSVANLATATVEITFNDTDGSKVIEDSVYNYLARTDALNKWSEDGVDESGLAEALMAFATSAADYLNNDNELPIN